MALLAMLSPLGLAAGNNWMACLDDSTRLSRITIPGTHDSGARIEPIPGIAKTQDFSIAEQLNFGVRYLDIRCRHLNDTFPVHHGPVFQELHFNEVLDQVYAFLKDNPTECVLMSVKPEHVEWVSPPKNNTRTFEETFDSYIADNVDMWWTEDRVPTLDTVRGRIVLVRRFDLDPSVTDEDRKKGIDATNWPDNTEFQVNNLSVQDHYKVDENAIKWDQVSRSLAAAAAETNPDILHLNFGSGYRPLLSGIPYIPAVSNYINPRIFTYFADAPPGHYGCVIMDFATAARSELIYSANIFKVATAGSGDPILAFGDPVLGIDEDIASNSNYPSTEGPGLIVDGSTATKYLNFGNENSGFIVTPAFGQSVLRSFAISTANDAIERDPASVIIYGTNKVIASSDNSGGAGESWTRIAELGLVLPDARSTPMSVLNVQNDEAFTSYKFVFPTMKGPNNNAMQISEVQFWDRNEGQGTAILQLNDPVLAIHEGAPESSSPDLEGPENLFDGNCLTKYLNFGKENSGFIITPAFGPSVAGSFVLVTADDFNGRDPVEWEIFGTNAEIVTEDNGTGQNEPWLSLGAGVIETPETNFTAAPEVFFENRTAYKSYKFLVREIRDPQGENVNSTQFSEFQLFSVEANSLDGRYDPNDSQNNAFDLTAKEGLPLSSLNGTRPLANDDWFEILVDPGEELVSVRCAFQHVEGNIDIALYDFAGNELVRSDSTTNDEEITYQVPGPGSYFIRVYGDEGNSYDLRWNDDDPFLGDDAELADLTASAGSLSPAFDPTVTSYSFDVANETSSTTVTPVLADLNFGSVEVRVNSGAYSLVSSGTASPQLLLKVGVNTIELLVTAANARSKTYTIAVTRATPPEDNYEGTTNNNTRETATNLSHLADTPLSTINGLGIAGDADWYRIEVSPGDEELHIICSFKHAAGDINLALYDATGAFISSSASHTDNEEIRTSVLTAGNYYIQVSPYPAGAAHRNTYDLWWVNLPQPIRITEIRHLGEIQARRLRITWDSSPGATYLLEQSENLTVWTPFGSEQPSKGTTTTVDVSLPNPAPDRLHIRVKRSQ
ncbi:phosphatidylinositol-specific phospholipase C domain-containing protein [Akkermansiaceae bacterium]|nr:phosphatidylinositol-specific phospholipase C domain-containing protein [Akkermansiaceae bacterium]